jgi:magnesium-transporting ATPase (P-type)
MKLFPRKTYLINPQFQLSIVSWFLIFAFILIAVFFFANWYFFYSFAQKAQAIGLQDGHIFFRFLEEQKNFMNKVFAAAGFATLVILTLGGIYISHKVAGPLHRFKKHLEQSSLKEVKKVDFRKGDYFTDIKDAFNAFISRS